MSQTTIGKCDLGGFSGFNGTPFHLLTKHNINHKLVNSQDDDRKHITLSLPVSEKSFSQRKLTNHVKGQGLG